MFNVFYCVNKNAFLTFSILGSTFFYIYGVTPVLLHWVT